MELLDCALIGVCAVIRLNSVYICSVEQNHFSNFAKRAQEDLIVLGFNDTSNLVDHFVSSPFLWEKRDSRRDEREEQGRKKNRN